MIFKNTKVKQNDVESHLHAFETTILRGSKRLKKNLGISVILELRSILKIF